MIAYSIFFHSDVDQFEVLFRNLYSRDKVFAIHLDRDAAPEAQGRLDRLAERYDNVYLVPRHRCVWAGWSLVASELAAIRLLSRLDDPWTHYINLSGQDMPLRPQEEIESFLRFHESSNFLAVLDPMKDWWNPRRFQFINIEQHVFGKSLIRVPRYRRPFIPGAGWYGGSQWKILTRAFCDYLSDFANIKRYVRYFRWAHMPDEQFFQTVIMNSRFRDTVINDNKRHIVFPDDTAHPKMFEAGDFDGLKSTDKLFARKFSVSHDDVVVRRVESELLKRELSIA